MLQLDILSQFFVIEKERDGRVLKGSAKFDILLSILVVNGKNK